jgi:hypothetical protein
MKIYRLLVPIALAFSGALSGCAHVADSLDDRAWHREPKSWWIPQGHFFETQLVAGTTLYRHSWRCGND